MKLYKVVDGPDYQEVVTWNINGNGISILSPEEFTRTALVDHYKGLRLTSFIRQLHYYGFTREAPLRRLPMNYSHRWFQRDQVD